LQLAGHDHLRSLGITLIPASSPNFFTEETPTAVLVRQIPGRDCSVREGHNSCEAKRPLVSGSKSGQENAMGERKRRGFR